MPGCPVSREDIQQGVIVLLRYRLTLRGWKSARSRKSYRTKKPLAAVTTSWQAQPRVREFERAGGRHGRPEDNTGPLPNNHATRAYCREAHHASLKSELNRIRSIGLPQR